MAVIHINDQKIEFDEDGRTILDIANEADIYIPTLCDHPELVPHGGCRMCLVEVEGMRGYVPACTTGAKDGQVVKTTTDDLVDLKRKILQLQLMEHPSACLVCFEWPGCLEYRTQTHKSGRATGCNTCAHRDDCELREVVEHLEIKDLDYPPSYKELEVERDDPFFDRDYNMCILCARCVRVCEEVRGTGAITFAKRGHETRVDTAFGSSHLESGCWFCGACVDVCPTGALEPRLTKWAGTPERIVETTCTLCATGCQVELDVKWDRVMGSSPASATTPPNFRQLCVLGRFCIPSLVNAPDRLKAPMIEKEGKQTPVKWEEAISTVAEKLKEIDPERIGFIGSPHLSVESAYLLQKLARVGVGTANIDFKGSEFPALIHRELAVEKDFDRISTMEKLEDADWIISVGGDFVKTHQVVAKSVYKAVSKGTPLIAIGEIGENLQRWITEHINVKPSEVHKILAKLADRESKIPGVDREQGESLVEITSQGRGAVIVDSRIMESSEPEHCLRALVRLAGDNGFIFPIPSLGNEFGVLRAGLQPDMLPGPSSLSVDDARAIFEKAWNTKLKDGLNLREFREKAKKGEIDTLFVTDGSVPVDGFEKVKTIIYQSPYPSQWMEMASVILPTTTFVEETGSFINHELRVLQTKQVVKPLGDIKDDWWILAELGRSLELDGFAFKEVKEVWDEVTRFARYIEIGGQLRRKSWKPAKKKDSEWNPQYRGATLAERIGDLSRFIEYLPKRETTVKEESLEQMAKRVEKERQVKAKEVS
ncbi:MAG: molybdopterin-dependent oxidoreductase [Candidatus Thorarchaeota archaeon]